MNIKFLGLVVFLFAGMCAEAQKSKKTTAALPMPGTVWSAEKANAWYKEHKWITGANYIPATAINQLEMWQAETFDPATIDKELGWAQNIGFNAMRVFLHHIAWHVDPDGFKKRMHDYLAIADKHGIKTMFVFFDDCWNKEPKAGLQPVPKPGIHNSGWMQDPGQKESYDSTIFPKLEKYVTDILAVFGKDKRILLDAMQKGSFFSSTGEVLISAFTVNNKNTGDTVRLNKNKKAAIAFKLHWTFPLQFAEIISGDGTNIYRDKINLDTTLPFGEQIFRLSLNLADRKWVRFEAWDIAANGAFTQTVWLK